jgi:hypothetical protein
MDDFPETILYGAALSAVVRSFGKAQNENRQIGFIVANTVPFLIGQWFPIEATYLVLVSNLFLDLVCH